MKLSHITLMLALFPMAAIAQNSECSLANEYPIAAQQEPIKGYIGLNLNYARAQLNDELGDALSYLTDTSIDTDDVINPNYFGFSINAGAQINRYFGMEAFLQHTLQSSAEIDFKYMGTSVGKYKSKTSLLAFGVDAMGYLPVTNSKFSFIGSLGAGYYKMKGKFEGINYIYDEQESESDTENNFGLRIGIGGQYEFSERWALRGMVRYVALNYDDDEDVVEGLIDTTIGVKYTF